MAGHRNSIHTKESEILVYQPLFPVKSLRSGKQLSWPLYVDEVVAELLGMLIHNGKVKRNIDGLLVRNTTLFVNFTEQLSQLLEQLGISLADTRQWQGLFRMQRPEIHSTEFARTFLDILECDRLTQLLGVENVPLCIVKSPIEIQYKFLIGYLNTCPKFFEEFEGKRQIKIVPYVETFALDIHNMLKLLDVPSTVVKDKYVYTDFNIDLNARV